MQREISVEDNAVKELAALHRAIPNTRMLDYGMAADDATVMSTLTVSDAGWIGTAESLAESRLRRARFAGFHDSGTSEFEYAAAAFNIAQLALSKDVPAKLRLYQRSGDALDESIQQSTTRLSRFKHSVDGDILHGWQLAVSEPIGCVVVIGGLSGWGTSYLGIARALAGRRICTLMAEGPGQGDTRFLSGIYLSRSSLPLLTAFVDSAVVRSRRIGVIGNSFGGLIAAHMAAAESRISACCINGAAPQIRVPDYRTVREQMEAAFDCEGGELALRLEELSFETDKTPIRCPTLILEGGQDPVVAPGVQAGFLPSHPIAGSMTRCWPDGEHTIYNHADERNDVIASWFRDRFIEPTRSTGQSHV